MEIEYEVANVSQYVKILCDLSAEKEKQNMSELDEYLFRGQPNKNYPLLPSICRDRETDMDCTILNDERNLIDMAKFKIPQIFHNNLSPIELLSLLQHYGIPTRLLDITENALVALYFACNQNDNEDGEVIVFKHTFRKVTNFPIMNAIADSYRFANATKNLSDFYADVVNQPYFSEQVIPSKASDKEKSDWIESCCSNILYIHAPIHSTRQQAQLGRYILFPNRIVSNYDKPAFELIIDPIPKDHTNISTRIIIPGRLKKQFIQDLAVLGINQSILFCDSIDIVCKGILDYFKQKYP